MRRISVQHNKTIDRVSHIYEVIHAGWVITTQSFLSDPIAPRTIFSYIRFAGLPVILVPTIQMIFIITF